MQRGQEATINLSNNSLAELEHGVQAERSRELPSKNFQWPSSIKTLEKSPRSTGGKVVPTKVKDIASEKCMELRRQNSANSLRALAMAVTPQRGGTARPTRNSSGIGLRRSPPARTSSTPNIDLGGRKVIRRSNSNKYSPPQQESSNPPSKDTKTRECSELRRQNSANSLRCLAMAVTPKRGSSGTEDATPRRTAPARTSSTPNIDLGGRKVIAPSSIRSPQRRDSLKDAPGSTLAVKTGIPGSIQIDTRRRRSCGGRLNTSFSDGTGSTQAETLDSEPTASPQEEHDDASCSSIDESDDDYSCSHSSESSSSIDMDDFDLEGATTAMWSQQSVPLKAKSPLSPKASSKNNRMSWRKDDGTIITEATPDELQNVLNQGIALAAQKREGTNGSFASIRSSSSSAIRRMEITVVHQNPPKPWSCLCGEENDHDTSSVDNVQPRNYGTAVAVPLPATSVATFAVEGAALVASPPTQLPSYRDYIVVVTPHRIHVNRNNLID